MSDAAQPCPHLIYADGVCDACGEPDPTPPAPDPIGEWYREHYAKDPSHYFGD